MTRWWWRAGIWTYCSAHCDLVEKQVFTDVSHAPVQGGGKMQPGAGSEGQACGSAAVPVAANRMEPRFDM